MTKVRVKTLRQWTEPNGTNHEPDEIAEIDTGVPGMDFDEHLLAQGVVEVVAEPEQPKSTRRNRFEAVETSDDTPESEV
jgi:hypothetical protein